MSLYNGEIVIDRLGTTRRSLERALAGVDREIKQRKASESYTSTYLSQLNDLARKAAALEDEIIEKLNYA